MILETIAGMGLKTILGGLTGIVGGWLKNKHDLEVKRLDMTEKAADRAHDLALMSREAETAERMANIKIEESMFVSDLSAMQETIKEQSSAVPWASVVMEKSHWVTANLLSLVVGFITFVQKMVRPGITIYLIILVHTLWSDMNAVMEAKQYYMASDQAYAIVIRIIDMILYLAGMSMAWWFCTRPPKNTQSST